MKKCITCKIEKDLIYFSVRSDSKDGYRNNCKECRATYEKGWRENNQEHINNYREENKDWLLANARQYKIDNAEQVKLVAMEYNRTHKEEIKIINKEYKQAHKEEVRKYRNNYYHEHKNDIYYYLPRQLRSRLLVALEGKQKAGSAIDSLGCSIEELILHFEASFYDRKLTGEKMTWKNRGLYGWHIDHIIPLSSFDLTDREQLLKAVHYTNLQPLWAEDNLVKGDKIV